MSSLSLLRAVSPRTRGALVVLAVLGFAARVALVFAALAASRGNAAVATGVVVAASACWLVHRLVASHTRVVVECELYRATSRALLTTDVLAVPTQDMQRVVFDGSHHARAWVGQTLPGFAADAAAVVVLLPVVLGTLPARVVFLALAALGIVVASLFFIRRATRRLHERVLAASERVYDHMLSGIEGRLELVARGGEEDHAQELDAQLNDYAGVARRATLGAAALGRVPLALAIAAVVIAALGDAAMRQSLETTVLTEALVLGAFAPVLLGLVVGVGELTRAGAQLRPVLELLASPDRPDLRRPASSELALPAIIEAKDVAFSYDAHAHSILDGVSFEWSPGRALVVVGPNGAGKSTLLRLLLGLRQPTRGRIEVGGVDIATVDLRPLRRRTAYLPQRPYLGESYTRLREAIRGTSRAASDDDIRGVLERVGLGNFSLDAILGELSAGQRQRLAIARVLAQRATLIVLDEPDANLDLEGISLVQRLIESLAADGKMVALAAHTEELAGMDGVRIRLENGLSRRVVAANSVSKQTGGLSV